jgi:hypothetical protein
MKRLVTQAAGRGPQRRSLRLTSLGALVAGAAMLASLVSASAPAYADVTSNHYTIGSPSGAVINVTASPSTVSRGATTSFELVFYVGAAFSGGQGGSITVAPSEALASAPADVAVVSGDCIQAGTAGAGGPGASTPTSLVIDLASTCNIAAKAKVEVDFDAAAPPGTGTFSFSVTTSANTSPGISNTVTVIASQVTLSAALAGFGANTTYSLGDVPVANLTAGDTTVVLKAAATEGTETLSFLNATAGYSVTVSSSSGAKADQVTAVSASGATATLTLADALATGDTLDITATGTNPPATGTVEADAITVTPGNGTPETSNSIVFGGSVRGVSVSPQDTVAGATTLYTVSFQATSAVSAGGNITLQEKAGPTDFTSVTGILVTDSTANWHFVATGTTLDDGTAVIPLVDSVAANDLVSVVLVNVTNPPAGVVRDFTVSTSADPVPADAAPYTIGPSASPGVVVTVEPTATGAVATYTISNLRAQATLAGGSATIGLQAPAGTVFPNNPSYYHVVDSTHPTGSGTVSGGLSGGGSNDVTFVVPNTLTAGDVASVTVEDVINPGTASSDYTITLVGEVTGPAPVPVTTTTPPHKTTTTVHHKPKPPVKRPKPKPRPVPLVVLVTAKAVVHKGAVVVELRCSRARCRGEVVLKDVVTLLGTTRYDLPATGRPARVTVKLDRAALRLIALAKHHTIKVRTTVEVTAGRAVKTKITVLA